MAKNRHKHPIVPGSGRRRQSGFSLTGVMLWGGVFMGIAYLGLKIYPLYYERYLVIKVMDTLVTDRKMVRANEAQLQLRFLRLAGLNGVKVIKQRNINDHVDVIKPRKKGDPRRLVVTYEARSELFANLDLMLKFHQERVLDGGSGGGQ